MFFGFSSEPSGQSGVPLHSSNEGMQSPSVQVNSPAPQVLPLLLLLLELALVEPLLVLQFLSIGASSEPSGQSGVPLHCKESWMQVPSLHVNWCVLHPVVEVQAGLSGDSSELSGQSKLWLHSSNEGMQVPSAHVNWSAVHGPPLDVEEVEEVEEEVAPPLLEPDEAEAEADTWLESAGSRRAAGPRGALAGADGILALRAAPGQGEEAAGDAGDTARKHALRITAGPGAFKCARGAGLAVERSATGLTGALAVGIVSG